MDSETKPAFVGLSTGIVSGTIRGDVTGSASGLLLSGVDVFLKLSLNSIFGVTTGDSGHYILLAPSGDYSLLASKSGFDTFEDDVSVNGVRLFVTGIVLADQRIQV